MTMLKKNNLVQTLEHNHEEAFQKTDQFYDVLVNLRYEGKASFGKNMKEAEDVLKFFHGEHTRHMKLEDDVLFPFIKAHVPKLEPVIHLLHAEHEDFKRNLQSFECEINELVKEKDESDKVRILEKIREIGTYMIYLLRSHNQSESNSIYHVIDHELHEDEIRELQDQIARYR